MLTESDLAEIGWYDIRNVENDWSCRLFCHLQMLILCLHQGDMKQPDVAFCFMSGSYIHPSKDLGGLHRHPKCYCRRFLSLSLNSVISLTTTSNHYKSTFLPCPDSPPPSRG
jgi:hypothetical protein